MVKAAVGAPRRSSRLRNGDKNKFFAKSYESISSTCHRIGVADSGSILKRIWREGIVMPRLYVCAAAIVAMALTLAPRTQAQAVQSPETPSGQITGTVTDVKGDAIVGATVILTSSPESTDQRAVLTIENGFFRFDALAPAVAYNVAINADGFAEWTSPPIILEPGQVKSLGDISLRIATQNTTMQVKYDPIEDATQQFKIEQTQRIFGIIPNFYTSFEGENAAPLTTKMKFDLAFKVSYDPVTTAGVGFVAGLRQAVGTPNYPQGAKGFGERFGVTAADGFTDIMIGGAILPSLLHQDPRYFYQGSGTTRTRLRHAILSAFIAKGDNGKWQPNYSSVGGDLASGALSNLYFPKSNRGVGLVFSLFALGTAERLGSNVVQEFLLGKFTRRRREGTEASAQ
jgi:Carboxypeptidase regulatory-like domain